MTRVIDEETGKRLGVVVHAAGTHGRYTAYPDGQDDLPATFGTYQEARAYVERHGARARLVAA